MWTQIINTWNRKIVLEKSFVQKWKSLNLGLTISYSSNFGPEFERNIFFFEISTSNLSACKLRCKNENSQIWDLKCFIWVFLGWNFQKLLSYLKLAPSDLYNIKVCWEPKMPYLGVFGLKFENNIVIFEISTLAFI